MTIMTNHAEGLLALAEACEKAEGADRVLDAKIYVAIEPKRDNLSALTRDGAVGGWVPNYTTSLDAAMKLLPARDWEYSLEWQAGSLLWVEADMIAIVKIGNPALRMEGEAAAPALALTAACLRARAASGEG